MTEVNVEALNFKPSNSIQATSLVAYQSRGHCLVIAPLERGVEVAQQLKTPGKTLFVSDNFAASIEKNATEDGLQVISGALIDLHGYLGAFDCSIGDAESPGSLARVAGVSVLGGFDLVLDLSEPPLLDLEVLPFGYFAPGNEQELSAAMQALVELQGDFEKPKYFEYDASICAHSRSGITACTQCLEVCGAGAITSNGDGISVEPYLCQGCGSCSSSCPSGAMRYAYPGPADAMSQLATLLADRRAAGHQQTVLFLHDSELGAARLGEFESDLADAIMPLAVEEVASIGIDGWACALAYGASAVVIDAPNASTGMRRGLEAQLTTAVDILDGLGMRGSGEHSRLSLMDSADAAKLNALTQIDWPIIPAANFKTFNDKRQTTRMAMDHLRQHSPVAVEELIAVDLQKGAPFGEVKVDQSSCTLCLACVTVCPGRALQDGETLPQLKFIETNCLQCGLCEQACPENAISLSPRFLYDSESALKPRIVNEEAPFNCIVCNTPFATQTIIGRMQTKLADHWMFTDGKAMRRLKMCEDCRVKDIFNDESGIDVHKS